MRKLLIGVLFIFSVLNADAQDFTILYSEDFEDEGLNQGWEVTWTPKIVFDTEVPAGWKAVPDEISLFFEGLDAVDFETPYQGEYSYYCNGSTFLVENDLIWGYILENLFSDGAEPEYFNNLDTRLRSPYIYLTNEALNGLMLDFAYNIPSLDHALIGRDDYFLVQLVYSDGYTVELFYTDNTTSGWTEKSIDLFPYLSIIPFRIEFIFKSDYDKQKEGVYIDDVRILRKEKPAISFLSPLAGNSYINGGTIPVTWTKNFSDPVNIFLKRNNGLIIGMAAYSETNDGSYTFDIPEESPFVIDAPDWFIEIENLSGTLWWRTGNFSIEPPFCNVPSTSSTISFGNLPPRSEPYTIRQTFTNSGNTSASVSITKSGSSAIYVSDNSFILPPNSSVPIDFIFDPASNTSYNATFTVVVNCDNCSSTTCGDKTWTIYVTGTGDEPDVSILQETQDYGEVYLGSSVLIAYRIKNLNPSSGITLTASTTNSTFTVSKVQLCSPVCTTVDEESPFYLEPAGGNVAILYVRFRPVTTGPVSASLVLSGGGETFQIGLFATGIEKVASPTINVSADYLISGDYYYNPVSVSMVNNHDGAIVRYTLDGSDPTSTSMAYTGPFTVSQSRTIKAKAFKTGSYIENSAVVTKNIYITGIQPQPVPNWFSGLYYDDLTIYFSNYSTDHQIFYTLNGSEPSASSTLYNHASGILLTGNTTLKAIAVKTNWLPGPVYSGIYQFEKILNPPHVNIDPSDTTFYTQIQISLYSDQGADIYYTTDGSDPDPASDVFTTSLILSETTTIKAFCSKLSWEPSDQATFTYNIDINYPVTDILLDNSSINENQQAGSVVGALTAADPDTDDKHTFRLVSGEGSTNNDKFYIIDSTLYTNEILDYEQYDQLFIRIEADDNKSGPITKAFIINVGNLEFSPTDIYTDLINCDENQIPPYPVGVLKAIDLDVVDGHIYSFVEGPGSDDNSLFYIQNDTVFSITSFNFEVKDTLNIRVKLSDILGQIVEKSLLIKVTNVNEKFTDFTLSGTSIDENNAPGSLVGSVTVTDEDKEDTYQYILLSGNEYFSVDASGNLYASSALNYEITNSYDIELRVVGFASDTLTKAFSITVNNINDPPSGILLSNNTINENNSTGTMIGSLTVIDEDQDANPVITLTDDLPDNDLFYIIQDELFANEAFNYENDSVFSVAVSANDGYSTIKDTFEIRVLDADDPLRLTSPVFEVYENNAPGVIIGKAEVFDEDMGPDPLIISDSDTIVHNFYTDQPVTVSLANTIYNIPVTVSGIEATSLTGGMLKSVCINVSHAWDSDLILSLVSPQGTELILADQEGGSSDNFINTCFTDDAGTNITEGYAPFTGSYIPEGGSFDVFNGENPNGVWNLKAIDVYDADIGTVNSWSISFEEIVESTGPDIDKLRFMLEETNDMILLDSVSGEIKPIRSFNYETEKEISFRVVLIDGTVAADTSTIAIKVLNVNEKPVTGSILFNVQENLLQSTSIGAMPAADPEGDLLSFSIISGNIQDAFSLENLTGILKVNNPVPLNYEVNPVFQLEVVAGDGSLSDTALITVNLTDVNDPPSGVLLESNTAEENKGPGLLIGKIMALDEDPDDHHIVSLKSGVPDNVFFSIINDTLVSPGIFNYEADSSYSVVFVVSDQFSSTIDTTEFKIINCNDPGYLIPDIFRIGENADPGQVIGVAGAGDEDALNDEPDFLPADLLFYLRSEDDSPFKIDSITGIITATGTLDYESRQQYSFQVILHESGSPSDTASYELILENINEQPSIEDLEITIPEEKPDNYVIDTLCASDPEGDELLFEILSGNEENGFFIGNQSGILYVGNSEILDFETTEEFNLTVTVTDGELSDTAGVVIRLTNVIEYDAIDDLFSDLLTVFPNPAEDKLFIKALNREIDISSIRLINESGQVLYILENIKLEGLTEIDLTDYSNGLYYIILRISDKVVSYKIVISH